MSERILLIMGRCKKFNFANTQIKKDTHFVTCNEVVQRILLLEKHTTLRKRSNAKRPNLLLTS